MTPWGRRAAALGALALAIAGCGGGDSGAASLKGSHVIGDGVDDHERALNARGELPKNPIDSGDIRGIRIEADGTRLQVRFAIGAPPLDRLPAGEKRGPSWFLQLWSTDKAKGEPAYFVAIARQGAAKAVGDAVQGWRLSVCPGTQVCTQPTPGTRLVIKGTEVRAEIPLDRLEKLRNPFSWVALSYWNDSDDPVRAWSDWVPDAARPTPGQTDYPPAGARAVFPPKR
ncbi:MAG: hypothetical protein ACRDJM_10935 [Actinomycetota bacterium]